MRTAKLKSSERSKDLAVEGLLGALLDMHMQKQSLEKLKQACELNHNHEMTYKPMSHEKTILFETLSHDSNFR